MRQACGLDSLTWGGEGAVWTLTLPVGFTVAPPSRGLRLADTKPRKFLGGAGGREVWSSLCLERVDTDGHRKVRMG